MRIGEGRSAEVAAWVAEQIGGPLARRGFGANWVVCLFDPNPVSAVVFNNWQPERAEIEISAAIAHPRYLTRPFIRAVQDYVDAIGARTVVAWADETNRRSRRLLTGLGFSPYPIHELDRVLFVLPRDRWSTHRLGGPNGISAQAARAS